MLKNKTPMRLSVADDQLFRGLYVRWRIPRGQYKKNADYLAEFTGLWNNLSGRHDSAHDVLHYMETQQKITSRLAEPWPTFKGEHRRLPPVADVITPAHAAVVRQLYILHILPLEIGTDSLSYRPELVDLLASEFFKATRINVPGMLLASWIETQRKAGRWITLRNQGYEDIESIG
jgi:hypothetical protein